MKYKTEEEDIKLLQFSKTRRSFYATRKSEAEIQGRIMKFEAEVWSSRPDSSI
jgi:hypothetical protein